MNGFRWLAIAFSVAFMTDSASGADVLGRQSNQLVIVITADWSATQGSLYRYEREREVWVQRDAAIPVSVGSKGSAWGLGIHSAQAGPQKTEGDGRSPAGLFTIGTAFGYSASERSRLRYQAMTQFDYCIDVNHSPLYNRIVDERVMGRSAIEGSTEPMRRDVHVNGDQRYKLGFVIEHNPMAAPMKGSCIFAHVWGAKGQPTAGCTAMEERSMRDLLEWLDSTKQPLFVLLPQAEYSRVAASWGLPVAPGAAQ